MNRLARALYYAAKRGLADVVSSPKTSLAITCAIAASLIAAGVIRLVGHNITAKTDVASSSPQLVVYLHADVEMPRARAIAGALESLRGTTSAEVVDSAEAHARLELALASDPDLVEGLADVQLPISIEVGLRTGLRDTAGMHPFADKLKAVDGVDSVEVLGEWTERGPHLVAALEKGSRWLLLLLSICAVFVAVVVMRFAARRPANVRALYRQLGASFLVTQVPGFVSGAVRGVSGAAVALLALLVFFRIGAAAIEQSLALSLGEMPLTFLPPLDVAAMLFGGAFIGAVAAAIANGRE